MWPVPSVNVSVLALNVNPASPDSTPLAPANSTCVAVSAESVSAFTASKVHVPVAATAPLVWNKSAAVPVRALLWYRPKASPPEFSSPRLQNEPPVGLNRMKGFPPPGPPVVRSRIACAPVSAVWVLRIFPIAPFVVGEKALNSVTSPAAVVLLIVMAMPVDVNVYAPVNVVVQSAAPAVTCRISPFAPMLVGRPHALQAGNPLATVRKRSVAPIASAVNVFVADANGRSPATN